MDRIDQWITREDPDLAYDDATVREAARDAVVEASRKLYDADLVCRRVEKGIDYRAMCAAERAKARAVDAWRAAMRALRETDPT